MSVNLKRVRFEIANPLYDKKVSPDSNIQGDNLKMHASGYIPNSRYNAPLDVEVSVDKSGLFSLVIIDSHNYCTLSENAVLTFNKLATGWHFAIVKNCPAFIYNVYCLDEAVMAENVRMALNSLETPAMEAFYSVAYKR